MRLEMPILTPSSHICRGPGLVLTNRKLRQYKCNECGQRWQVSGGEKNKPLKAERVFRLKTI